MATADRIEALGGAASPGLAVESGVMTYSPKGSIIQDLRAKAPRWAETEQPADRLRAGNEKLRFLVKNKQYIWSPERVQPDSVLAKRGWVSVELNVRDIWPEVKQTEIAANSKNIQVAPSAAQAIVDADMEKRLLIAADSIGQLRKLDVERVLTQGNLDALQMANFIRQHRPDLASEVDEVMAEMIEPAKATEALQIGAPIQDGETTQKNRIADRQRIDDFGEKLGGAKKDRDWSFGKDISDSEMARLPFSKIWPADEADKMESVFAAAVAVTARASVPAKPRVSHKLNHWVKKVQTVRNLAQRIVRGEISESHFKDKLDEASGLADFRAKVLLLEKIDRSQWGRIGKVEEFPDAYQYVDAIPRPSPFVMVEIDGKSKRFDGCKSSLDAVDRISSLLQVEAVSKKMAFEVRGRAGAFFINKTGDREYRKLKTFSSPKEAFAFIADHHDQLVAEWEKVKDRDNVGKGDVRGDENRPRTGQDWRKGKDVTPEQFIEDFGFRGVEFGNWVNQGSGGQERQGMLNQAYDALMDLSAIVGIPSKAISLNGSLGLAFGSRGSGNASAHYEPGNLVINLTKTRGAGSLAHEWFHSLDNYFARARHGGEVPMGKGLLNVQQAQQSYREANYITYRPEPMMIHLSGRVKPMTADQLERNRLASPKSGFFKPENWIKDPRHPDGVRPEVEALFAQLVKTLDQSPMTARSQMNDKGENGYWGRIIERAARSFENFAIASMEAQGYHNDYLANVRPASEFRRDLARYPYLLPEEIPAVKTAFGELFAGIKTKETEKGIALFSMGGEGVGAGEWGIGDRHTVESLTGEIDAAMGQPGLMHGLMATGKVAVVESGLLDTLLGSQSRGWDAGDGSIVWANDGRRPMGMVLEGKVYLVADHVDSSVDLKGLLLHEVGVHALHLGRSDNEFKRILAQFDHLEKTGDARARAAFAKVPEGTPPAVRTEEALGYFVEANPELPLARRVISWFKSQVAQLADKLPVVEKTIVGQWAKSLTGDDLVYMATAATRRGGELLARGMDRGDRGTGERAAGKGERGR